MDAILVIAPPRSVAFAVLIDSSSGLANMINGPIPLLLGVTRAVLERSSALLRSSHRTKATIPLARGSVMRAVALALIEHEIPRTIAVWRTA